MAFAKIIALSMGGNPPDTLRVPYFLRNLGGPDLLYSPISLIFAGVVVDLSHTAESLLGYA